MQVITDNVDHNSVTLDGKDTFHRMGFIVTLTPSIKRCRNIPLLKAISSSDLIKLAQIERNVLPKRKAAVATFKPLPPLMKTGYYGVLTGLIIIKNISKIDPLKLNNEDEAIPKFLIDIHNQIRLLVSGDLSLDDIRTTDQIESIANLLNSLNRFQGI